MDHEERENLIPSDIYSNHPPNDCNIMAIRDNTSTLARDSTV